MSWGLIEKEVIRLYPDKSRISISKTGLVLELIYYHAHLSLLCISIPPIVLEKTQLKGKRERGGRKK